MKKRPPLNTNYTYIDTGFNYVGYIAVFAWCLFIGYSIGKLIRWWF